MITKVASIKTQLTVTFVVQLEGFDYWLGEVLV